MLVSPYASAFQTARPPVALIGAGAVGRVLGHRLRNAGYPICAVISRARADAEHLARELNATVASASLLDVPRKVELVLLCVPDNQVEVVAGRLGSHDRSWSRTVVAHTSGVLPSAALCGLAEVGARTLSFHPLQTLTRTSSARALDDVYVGLEGAPRAVAAGIELASGLGLRYIVLTPEAKARYHLAATVASNFLVALAALSQEILSSAGINRGDASALLGPLLRETLRRVESASPEEVLTGPVVRGDTQTVDAHLDELGEHLPHLLPVYGALSVEAVRIAIRSSRLDPERAEVLLELVGQAVNQSLHRSLSVDGQGDGTAASSVVSEGLPPMEAPMEQE